MRREHKEHTDAEGSHRNTLTPRGGRRLPVAFSGVAVSLQKMGSRLLLTQPCTAEARLGSTGWPESM